MRPIQANLLPRMKPLFPLLLTYVMLTTQTFAISGGPVFGGGGVNVPGIYSGVLQGVTETQGASGGPVIPGDPVPPADNGTTGEPSNAIGLFDLTIPVTALATGTFIMFADGVVFTGTIDASGDIDTGIIQGVLQGAFEFMLTTFDATGAAVTSQVSANALGRVTAQVVATNDLFATSLARLTGTANLGVSFGEVNISTLAPIVARTITFDVTGFKQSN